MLTSVGGVKLSSMILRTFFSIGSDSKRGKKSTTVFNLTGICAMVNLNCRIKSQSFHNGGGNFLV